MPVYMNFYMWHVLNADNITNGIEKPRFQERGPYAYKEVRKKVSMQQDIFCCTYNGQNSTLLLDALYLCPKYILMFFKWPNPGLFFVYFRVFNITQININ